MDVLCFQEPLKGSQKEVPKLPNMMMNTLLLKHLISLAKKKKDVTHSLLLLRETYSSMVCCMDYY